MGPLGKVGTHDRPLEIRAQKYVSDVNSGGQGRGCRYPSSPVPSGDTETRAGQDSHLGWKEASGSSRARPSSPH